MQSPLLGMETGLQQPVADGTQQHQPCRTPSEWDSGRWHCLQPALPVDSHRSRPTWQEPSSAEQDWLSLLWKEEERDLPLPCSGTLCNCWRERSCYRKISSEGAVLRRHGAVQVSSQMLLQSKLSIILLFCSEGSGSDWQFVALSSLHFPTIHKKQILLHSAGSHSMPGTCHLHCNEHSDCRHLLLLLLLNVELPEHSRHWPLEPQSVWVPEVEQQDSESCSWMRVLVAKDLGWKSRYKHSATLNSLQTAKCPDLPEQAAVTTALTDLL